jgi:precorrin-2 dehydrogenase/sirohydrochlorin ferrochelatase
MKNFHPIAIKIKNRKVVISGAGYVAERKVRNLLPCGAEIKVVAPTITSGLMRLAKNGRIKWIDRKVRKSDLMEADIIFAATDSAEMNKKVSIWANEKGKLINLVDNSVLSSFISPAIVRRRKAIIAVYSDGKSPELSRDIKNFLKDNWDEFISYRKRLQKRVA